MFALLSRSSVHQRLTNVSAVETTGRPRGRLALVRNGSFARLWWSGAVSSFGDWISIFASLALGDQLAGNTGTLVALLGRFAPALILGLFSGVLADRSDRRLVMAVTDLARAVLVLALVFVDTLSMLFVVQVGLEIFAQVRQPAREAAVPQLVSKDELVAANAVSAIGSYGTFPLGAIAWFLMSDIPTRLGAAEAVPFRVGYITDSITFIVSAAIVLTLVLPPVETKAPTGGDWRQPFRDLVEGVRFVVGTPEIRGAVVGLSAVLFGGGAMIALGQSYTRALGGAVSGFSVVALALGAGFVIGMSALNRLKNLDHLVVFAFSLTATGVALSFLSYTRTVIGAGAWSLLLGAAVGMDYVMGFTLIQQNSPDELRGRAFAALFTVVRAALILSMSIATAGVSLLDDVLPGRYGDGTRVVLLLGGIIAALSGVFAFWSGRTTGQEQPA